MAKRKKKRIHIKKKNQGKTRKATGTKKGQKIPVSKLRARAKSKNPKTRKRAQFALNARKWKKGGKKRRKKKS
jgi:oligoendopeptidase F